MLESVTMISWDLDPFRVRGGTAYATRRLADQLIGLGIKTTILLPDWLDTPLRSIHPLLTLTPLALPASLRFASFSRQHVAFCRSALAVVQQVHADAGSGAIIAHNDEGALFVIMHSKYRSKGRLVLWLHSLYDPPVDDFPKELQPWFPSGSVLASAVRVADLVVTSSGVLQDTLAFEWPDRLKALQNALQHAEDERRVLTVESMGCLPEYTHASFDNLAPSSNTDVLDKIASRYIFFPGRPTVDKGLPIFTAIAEQLRTDNIACVAVERPRRRTELNDRARKAPIVWLPWLSQDNLFEVMRRAACVVLPSITEGYGLATAESIRLGVPTLYQAVGGHHSLEGFPGAIPVPITMAERRRLYRLWSDLLMDHPNSWAVWNRHERSLRPLVYKWADAVKKTVNQAPVGASESEHLVKPPVEDRWANRLLDRINGDSLFQRKN